MQEFFIKYKKPLLGGGILLLVIVCAYLFFHFLLPLIAPFVFGALLSLLFSPVVTFLNKKLKCPRWLGTTIAIAGTLALLTFLIVVVVSRIVDESLLLYHNLPEYLESFKSVLDNINAQFNDFLLLLPESFRNYYSAKSEDIWNTLIAFFSASKPMAPVNFVLAIPRNILILILSFLSAFFFTKDKEKIQAFLRSILPDSAAEKAVYFRKNLLSALGGYLRAQLILMTFTFTICAVGLLILDSPYALLLALVTSLIDALPFFGSGFILWPGAALHLLFGDTGMAVGFIIIYLIVILMRQLLEPKVLGTQIGLHPLITLFSMYLGLRLIGVFGMILGPIIAVLVKGGYDLHTKQRETLTKAKTVSGAEPPNGPDNKHKKNT